jgi:hypothetical protein
VFGALAAPAGGGGADLDDFFRDRTDDDDDDAAAVRLRLVLFRDEADEHPAIARQASAAAAVAAERGIGLTQLAAQGRSRLERLASLIGLVDYASMYLAFALGVDPLRTLAAHDLGGDAEPHPLPG